MTNQPTNQPIKLNNTGVLISP